MFFGLAILNSVPCFEILFGEWSMLPTMLRGGGVLLLIDSCFILPLAVLVNKLSEMKAWVGIFPRSGFAVLGVTCLGIRKIQD